MRTANVAITATTNTTPPKAPDADNLDGPGRLLLARFDGPRSAGLDRELTSSGRPLAISLAKHMWYRFWRRIGSIAFSASRLLQTRSPTPRTEAVCEHKRSGSARHFADDLARENGGSKNRYNYSGVRTPTEGPL